MAPITINRTPWGALIDDSGGNLDGTPWTKDQIKVVLLDQIDAALAKVPVDAATGKIPDSALSANVALKNAANTFSATPNVFSGQLYADGGLIVRNVPLDLQSGQLKFPAAQLAAADPNTFDDYEEGTWTPSLLFGGAAVGMTYSEQKGFYIKVGGKVYLGVRIVLTSKGTSTGAATIAGLPFVDKDLGNFGGSCNFYSGMAAAVSSVPSFFTSGAAMSLAGPGAGSYVALDHGAFTSTSILIGSVLFRAN